jgi:hypothetical protein
MKSLCATAYAPLPYPPPLSITELDVSGAGGYGVVGLVVGALGDVSDTVSVLPAALVLPYALDAVTVTP